jgi:hypothetical protein
METITIMKTRKTSREKVIYYLSAVLFALLYLVPGLSGSYVDAQCGGGGGGGSSCTSGGPGSSSCSLEYLGVSCSVTCNTGYYACCSASGGCVCHAN